MHIFYAAFSIFVTICLSAAKRPELKRKLMNVLVPEGGNAKFECQVDGMPMPQVTWWVTSNDLLFIFPQQLGHDS